jgi:DNA-binding transcriptional regulator YdaS (Cro superfamily)
VKPTRTDALGLYDFRIFSRRISLSLEASYQIKSGQKATTTVSFAQRTAQAAILPDRLIVKPGGELGVNVQTKSRSGYVYLEGLASGRRFHVASKAIQDGVARFRVVVPRQAGLFRLQATDDFANPGPGIATRSLFVDPAEATDLRWLERLARAVKKRLDPEDIRTHAHLDALLARGLLRGKDVASGRAAAYLLSRLDHRHYPTAWVADTSAADAGTVKKRRRRLQTYMILGLAFTAVLLLAVVLPMIYTNVLLHRQGAAERAALMAEFEGEVAAGQIRESWHDGDPGEPDDDELSPEQKARRATQAEKLSRVQHVMQIVVVTGVIILAVAMMLILLLNLTWSLDV